MEPETDGGDGRRYQVAAMGVQSRRGEDHVACKGDRDILRRKWRVDNAASEQTAPHTI